MHPPPPTTRHPPLVAFAHQLADAAGAAIRPYFGAHGAVETKGDASPVTAADRAAEAAMRALIEKEYPDHAIYGEELGATHHPPPATRHAYTWVLDPIDGTRAFIAGKKEWGTLICLCEDGVPILGILDQPVTGERWVGVRGQVTRFFNTPLPSSETLANEDEMECKNSLPHRGRVRVGAELAVQTLSDVASTAPLPSSPLRGEGIRAATLSTTSRNYFNPPQARAFVRLSEQCGEVIEGGDCYAYGLLAKGERDLVVDAGLKLYDILALVPIVEGAGGIITGWDGAPITLTHFDTALAAGVREIYQAAQRLLA